MTANAGEPNVQQIADFKETQINEEHGVPSQATQSIMNSTVGQQQKQQTPSKQVNGQQHSPHQSSNVSSPNQQ